MSRQQPEVNPDNAAMRIIEALAPRLRERIKAGTGFQLVINAPPGATHFEIKVQESIKIK